MTNQFDASASMLGYFYQVRYALFLILSSRERLEKGIFIKIEGLDDIEIRKEEDIIKELVQTKHLKAGTTITNSSKHFWKTMRIWSEHIANGKIVPTNTIFTLVINSKPSPESIVDLLSVDRKNINKALQEMESFIKKSKTKDEEILKCYQAFNQLADKKKDLLNSVQVLALQPNIKELENKIKDLLKLSCWPEHLDKFSEDLDSWWFQRVIEQIENDDSLPITLKEINDKIQDLRDNYPKDSLPVSFDGKKVELPDTINSEQFIFQLKEIGYNRVIELAKQDYYKAYLQRSEWTEKYHYLSLEEIMEYEKKLIEKWEFEFGTVCDRFESNNNQTIDSASEKDLKMIGQEIYEKVFNKHLSIRKVTAEYVMRGSYHMLANQPPTHNSDEFPRVHWHPNFKEFLKKKVRKC